MKYIIDSNLKGRKLFENIKLLLDKIVTMKEERQRLENEIRLTIQRHEEVLMRPEMEDRMPARHHESDALKAGSLNVTQSILAYSAIVAFFAMTATSSRTASEI